MPRLCLALCATLLMSAVAGAAAAPQGEIPPLFSPDQRLEIRVTLREKIYYSVFFKGRRVLQASPLSLELEKEVLGADPRVLKIRETAVDGCVPAVWGSRSEIPERYRQMTLDCEGGYSVEFRAYDQGVAYRFVTHRRGQRAVVRNEEVAYRFDFGVSAWMLDEASYETNYARQPLDVRDIQDFKNARRKIPLPVVVEAAEGVKVLITEAGLHDYPSLFLDRGNDYENFLNGTFEKYALETRPGGFSNYAQVAAREADYMAATSGAREYPWRLMIISDDDRTFADCNLVWLVSKPCALKDTSWIRPGKAAWDWWHDYVVEGADFKGGVNTATYLYHIDFAARYGLEYILIDWQWTDKYDLTLFNPEVDLDKIVHYGAAKGVRVIVWCPGHTLYRQLDKALDLFAAKGLAGVKADFFGREDQTGIRMYEEIARAAAARKLLVDFHGCAKPTGLSRTWPNIINLEAVAGNEWNKLNSDKATVAHKALLPFIRGPLGPMDYTPGGLRNLQSGHNLRFTLPSVHGTRAGEISLFVIYNEPLKMLCDAPGAYDREPETTRLIAGIPTTWDDTRVLEARFGEYLVVARRRGEVWYVAGLNGEEARGVEVDFGFLGEGRHTASILKDGADAQRVGTDHRFETVEITRASKLRLAMARGGGFVMRIPADSNPTAAGEPPP
jgi:alpha-glucosidase